jgi:hypothetical protein
MVDLKESLATVERLVSLMVEKGIDEISIDYINVKKGSPRPTQALVIDHAAALAKHIAPPLDNDPWNAVSQEDADKWAAGGKQ